MTRDEFNPPFQRLQDAFEHHPSDGTARLYYDLTRGYPATEWTQAVEETIRDNDSRWPRVASLLKILRRMGADRQEREQRARETAARYRITSPASGVSVDTGLLPPALKQALADKMAGRITQEQLEQIAQEWAG